MEQKGLTRGIKGEIIHTQKVVHQPKSKIMKKTRPKKAGTRKNEGVEFSATATKALGDNWREQSERIRRGELTLAEARYRNACQNSTRKPEGHVEIALDPTNTLVKAGLARLYTVTTLSINPVFGGDRNVAVCTKFEEAKRIVETNEFDIHEGSYHLVVIESVFTDCVYGGLGNRDQYWYTWEEDGREEDKGQYVPIMVPPGYERVSGYGIG